AVEVVLLDAHLLGHLGDRDAGTRADELERLLGARAAAARPPATPGAAPGARPRSRAAPATAAAARRARRRGRVPDTVEGGRGRLEAVIFVNERPQLLQPRVDLTLLLFQEVGHVPRTVHRGINSSIPARQHAALTV